MSVRPLVLVLALTCGVGSSLLVGCGNKDTSGLIAASNSQDLLNHLESLRAAVDSKNCTTTGEALAQLNLDLEKLPRSVDSGLREELRSGYEKLQRKADTECKKTETQATTEATTAETTTPETTTTEEAIPTETVTEPTTPETTPTEPTTTSNPGGVQPGPTTTAVVPPAGETP